MPHVTTVAPVDGRLILAEGEQTGHHHSIKASPHIALMTNGVQDFLAVQKRAAKLTHDEHDTLTVPVGDYEVVHQRRAEMGLENRSVPVFD